MAQGLLGRCAADRVDRPRPKGSARRGEHHASYVCAASGGKRLENRIVLGIDRQYGRSDLRRPAHEECACTHQALLVGKRDSAAALDRREGGLEASRSGDRRHHPLRRPLSCLDHRSLAGRGFDIGARNAVLEIAVSAWIGNRSKTRAKLASELGQGDGIAICAHRLDAVVRALALDEIDGARADRAGSAEDRHCARRGDRGRGRSGKRQSNVHRLTIAADPARAHPCRRAQSPAWRPRASPSKIRRADP